jgi:hypothetical protein
MPDRRSKGLIAVLCVILALSAVATAVACGSGSWTPATIAGRHSLQSNSSPWLSVDDALATWCSAAPGEGQQALQAAMGVPSEQGMPGHGREIGFNVTPQPELSLVISIMPMHRLEGYAMWRRDGYLLADTYSHSGAIDRLYAWPIEVSEEAKFGCQQLRGSPFGPVTVPNVVGRTVLAAEAALHTANLTPSIPAVSNVWLRSAPVGVQDPAAGTSVAPGTAVRLNPYLHGVLCFVYCGLTLQPTGGIATLGVSKDEAIAIYRQHSPGPSGAPTAVLLGYMSSHRGAGPRMHHWLVWVVEYKHAPIPLYGPRGGTAIGTWIGVIDARTGRYLTTQTFG